MVNNKGSTEDIEKVREMVLKRKVNVNAQNLKDVIFREALHFAAAKGFSDLVQVLVEELGAEIHSQDQMDFTAMDYAIRNKHWKIAKYLFDKGTRRNRSVAYMKMKWPEMFGLSKESPEVNQHLTREEETVEFDKWYYWAHTRLPRALPLDHPVYQKMPPLDQLNLDKKTIDRVKMECAYKTR